MFLIDLFYAFLLLLLSPLLLLKSCTDSRFRKTLFAKLRIRNSDLNRIPDLKADMSKKRIWVHGASVGEVSLAIKLIREWQKSERPETFILTTNTLTGLEIARREKDIPSLIAPFDFSFLIRRFLNKSGVRGLILMETEIWPNMIPLSAKKGRIAIVNGRLSDKHIKKYLRFRFFFKKILNKISIVLAGDQQSEERFVQIGIEQEKVRFFGNLKFELPPENPTEILEKIRTEYSLKSDQPLMVAGSIQPEEVPVIYKAWKESRKSSSNLRLIMIPRHPDKREAFTKELSALNATWYTASREASEKQKADPDSIQIIDLMGVLKAWYGLADIIFVGGSLCNRGGQNMLEAVALKKAVCIGPFATNFQQEVTILQSGKSLEIVHNETEMAAFIQKMINYPQARNNMAERGYQLIVNHSGALQKNLATLIRQFD